MLGVHTWLWTRGTLDSQWNGEGGAVAVGVVLAFTLWPHPTILRARSWRFAQDQEAAE